MINNHYSQENVTRFTYNPIMGHIVQSIKDHPNYQQIKIDTVKEGSAATTYLCIYFTTDLGYNGIHLDKECYYVCSYHIFEPIADYRYKVQQAFLTHLHNYFKHTKQIGGNNNE
jgi:hypothetical protein